MDPKKLPKPDPLDNLTQTFQKKQFQPMNLHGAFFHQTKDNFRDAQYAVEEYTDRYSELKRKEPYALTPRLDLLRPEIKKEPKLTSRSANESGNRLQETSSLLEDLTTGAEPAAYGNTGLPNIMDTFYTNFTDIKVDWDPLGISALPIAEGGLLKERPEIPVRFGQLESARMREPHKEFNPGVRPLTQEEIAKRAKEANKPVFSDNNLNIYVDKNGYKTDLWKISDKKNHEFFIRNWVNLQLPELGNPADPNEMEGLDVIEENCSAVECMQLIE